MAKYEKKLVGDFDYTLKKIHASVLASGSSVKLVDESYHTIGDTKLAVNVYDKYFMRNGNRASLSLTIMAKADEIFVSAIGAGGGSGIIFNFSFGAEDDMVRVVSSCLESY